MTGLNAPAWLTARPIAHRGLHDAAAGIVENTPSAARAAIAGGYAIECDVQLTADGDAAVIHDDTTDRLMTEGGKVADRSAAALAALSYKAGGDRIVTLADFLALIGRRTPLICEIKSRFDGDLRLAERALAIGASYDGPLAFKSFDPEVIAHLRRLGAPHPLGMIAERRYDHPEWAFLGAERIFALSNFLHFLQTRPDFLSFYVEDLPGAVPLLCRAGMNMPVMSWTVRTPAQRQRAAQWADQIVFEGFRA